MSRYAQALSADLLSSSKLFCHPNEKYPDTDSDPISGTTTVVLSVRDTAVDADIVSACIEANDSLHELLQHGKRQSVEVDANELCRV